jgi:hypothetical protein
MNIVVRGIKFVFKFVLKRMKFVLEDSLLSFRGDSLKGIKLVFKWRSLKESTLSFSEGCPFNGRNHGCPLVEAVL